MPSQGSKSDCEREKSWWCYRHIIKNIVETLSRKSSPRPNPSSYPPLRKYSLLRFEDQLVGELALRQAEACPEVLGEVLGLLDRRDDGRVNRLLVSSLRLRECLLRFGLALSEEFLLS